MTGGTPWWGSVLATAVTAAAALLGTRLASAMTVTEPDRAMERGEPFRVSRSVIEGAKLQITINRRLGLPVDPDLIKIANAKPAA